MNYHSLLNNWGEDSSVSSESTTTNTTTITLPPQEATVQPRSKVEVTTDFFEFTDTVFFLLDLYVENRIPLICKCGKGGSCGDYSYKRGEKSVEVRFGYDLKAMDPINSIAFEGDEVKFILLGDGSHQSPYKLILKDFPVMMETTELMNIQ